MAALRLSLAQAACIRWIRTAAAARREGCHRSRTASQNAHAAKYEVRLKKNSMKYVSIYLCVCEYLHYVIESEERGFKRSSFARLPCLVFGDSNIVLVSYMYTVSGPN